MRARDLVPARMTFEDCARLAAAANRRIERTRASDRQGSPGRGTRAQYNDGVPLKSLGSGDFQPNDLSRLTLDWIGSIRSPDDELRGMMRRVRGRARELERTNAYAEGYFNAQEINIVGATGFAHQAQMRDRDGNLIETLNKQVQTKWRRWAMDGSVTRDRGQNLVEFLNTTVRTVPRDGEGLVRLHRARRFRGAFAVEPIDADLLDDSLVRSAGREGNEIRMGVEVDGDGGPIAYHVLEGEYDRTRDRARVPYQAADVLHLYRRKRPNQARGIVWILPAMLPLWVLDKYEEAELFAARAASAKMGFFVSKGGPEAEEYDPEVNANDQGRATVKPLQMMAEPGVMEQLPKGWEFQSWDPEHPTTAFGPFLKAGLRKIATGVHMSYNALANDLEGVNYSSMRSGVIADRDVWRARQQWYLYSLVQPIYRNWLGMQIVTGEINVRGVDPDTITDALWTPRGWLWVDPLKDITAAALGIQWGVEDRTTTAAERGREIEEILERLDRENQLATQYGVLIRGEEPQRADANKGDENGNGNGNGNGRAHRPAAPNGRTRLDLNTLAASLLANERG